MVKEQTLTMRISFMNRRGGGIDRFSSFVAVVLAVAGVLAVQAPVEAITLKLRIGDPSGSGSENYDLKVGPHTLQDTTNPGTTVHEGYFEFEPGRYEVTVTHTGSIRTTPDYDWIAQILFEDGSHLPVDWVEDSPDILSDAGDAYPDRMKSPGSVDPTGKVAYLIIPGCDLVVDGVAETEEVDPGVELIQGVIVPVEADIANGLASGTVQLSFQNSCPDSFKLYTDSNATNEATAADLTWDASAGDKTFYAQAVGPCDPFNMVLELSGTQNQDSIDEVRVVSFATDLIVDGIAEELEDNPGAVLIAATTGERSLVPVEAKLSDGLGGATANLSFQSTWPAGFKLYTDSSGTTEATIAILTWDAALGGKTFYAEAVDAFAAFQLVLTLNRGSEVSVTDEAKITGYMVDLVVNHVPNDLDDDPGAELIVSRRGQRNIVPVVANAADGLSGGTVKISSKATWPEGFKLFSDISGANEVRAADLTWSTSDGPKTFYAEAVAPFEPFDLTLTLVTPSGDKAIDKVKITGACSTAGGQTGSTEGGLGSIDFAVNLGGGGYGKYSGKIFLHADSTSPELSTPAALQLVAAPWVNVERVDGEIRRVTLPDGSEIVISSDAEDAGPKMYTMTVKDPLGAPIRTITVENPSLADWVHNELKITDTGGTGNYWHYKRVSDGWHLSRGTSSTSIDSVTKLGEVWNAERTQRTETITHHLSITSPALEKTAQTYHRYPWGEELIERVEDPDDAALRATWMYHDDRTESGYGKLKSHINARGYWEHYVYDSADHLIKTIRQYGDNPYDASDLAVLEATNVVEEIDWLPDLDLDNDQDYEEVKRTVVRVEGAQAAATYEIKWNGFVTVDGVNYEDETEIRCVTPDPASIDYAGNTEAFLEAVIAGTDQRRHLVTQTRRFAAKAPDGTAQADAFQVKRKISPNGLVQLYHRFVSSETWSDRGFIDPTLDSDGDAMDLGDVTHGTLTHEVVDTAGNVEKTTTWRRDGGSWFVQSHTKTTQSDEFGRPKEESHYFGTNALTDGNSGATPAYTTALSYGTSFGCGCSGGDAVVSRTDRAGIQTTYSYDNMGRQKTVTEAFGTSGALTTETAYDAAGRVKTITRGSSPNQIVIAEYDYDHAGRVTSVKDGEGNSTYYTYRRIRPDGTAYTAQSTGAFYQETRVYPPGAMLGPAQIIWTDTHGRTVRSWTAEVTWQVTPPWGGEQLHEVGRTIYAYDWAGRTTSVKTYHNLDNLSLADIGNSTQENENYYESHRFYDAIGRQIRSISEVGDITATVFDAGGRAIETWRGTDATGATEIDPSGNGAGGNDMVLVSRTFYDVNRDGTGKILSTSATRVTRFRPCDTLTGTASDYTYTDYDQSYGAEGQTVWAKPAGDSNPAFASSPWTKQVTDYQGRPVEQTSYVNGSETQLVSHTTFTYSPAQDGRLLSENLYEVVGGVATSNKLVTSYRYDDAGRRFHTNSPDGMIRKNRFDVHGRLARAIAVSFDGSPATPDDDTDDVVLEETVYDYDDTDRVIKVSQYERHHDAGAVSGLLSSSPSIARATYSGTWYDAAGRPTIQANYGGNDFVHATANPTPGGSPDVIVTQTHYFPGQLTYTIDNANIASEQVYDGLGRLTKLVESIQGGETSSDRNRTTEYTYRPDGQQKAITATNVSSTGTTSQTTTYVYSGEVDELTGPVPSNSYLRAIIYPDSDNAVISRSFDAPNGWDRVAVSYNADGSLAARLDQQSTLIEYAYDDSGRLVNEIASVMSGSLPGDEQISRLYDHAGRLDSITAYSDTTVTSVVDYTYDGYGNVQIESQDHRIPGGYTAGIPAVTYNRDPANGNRLTSVTYPNGHQQVHLLYDGHAGVDAAVGRVTALASQSTRGTGDANVIADYQRLGSGTPVITTYPTPNVQLDRTSSTAGAYDGFDHLGRIIDQRWIDNSTSHDTLRVQYGYDGVSNRLYAKHSPYEGASQVYQYDRLHRLKQYQQGLINGNNEGIQDHWQTANRHYHLDSLGNQRGIDERPAGGSQVAGQDWENWLTHNINNANEYTNHSVRAGKPKSLVVNEGFDDINAWFMPSEANDGHAITAGEVSFSPNLDTLEGIAEPEPAAILLLNAPTQEEQVNFAIEVTFSELTSGQAGLIYHYKSPNDYYLVVLDSAIDGTTYRERRYRVYNGSKTHSSSTIRPLTAGVPQVLSIRSYRGRVGIWSNTSNASFNWARLSRSAEQLPLGPRWAAYQSYFDDSAFSRIDASADRLYLQMSQTNGSTSETKLPIVLEGLHLEMFQATFALRRHSTAGWITMFIPGPTGDERASVKLHHGSQIPVTAVWGNQEKTLPSAPTATDVLWFRVIQDACELRIHCQIGGDSEPGESTWDWGNMVYTSTEWGLNSTTNNLAFGATDPSGGLFSIDNLTVYADNNGDGAFNTLEYKDNFTSDGGVTLEPVYDKAGNLTFDGRYQYTYDAWNRLVSIERAWREGTGPVETGSEVSIMAYDGLGRRIKKVIQRSGFELNSTYHYYYAGQSIIEERNGSDMVLKQHIWANLAGGYIDELIQTTHNRQLINDPLFDPSDPEHTGTTYWALHDASYNVLGIVDTNGALRERYEYTPYGERMVFKTWAGTVNDPDRMSGPVPVSGVGFTPTRINSFGHQGLQHDEELGLIHNRARTLHPRLGRFMQRDPLGYLDGMSLYGAYHLLHGGVDPTGMTRGRDFVSIFIGRLFRKYGTFGIGASDWLWGDVYWVGDREGTLLNANKKRSRDFVLAYVRKKAQSLPSGFHEIDVDNIKDIRGEYTPGGNWSYFSGEVFGDGGFWINGATGIEVVDGSIQICREAASVTILKFDIAYTWHDWVDANSFIEKWNGGEFRRSLQEGEFAEFGVHWLEALADIYIDKKFDLDYGVKIPMRDTRDNLRGDAWTVRVQ